MQIEKNKKVIYIYNSLLIIILISLARDIYSIVGLVYRFGIEMLSISTVFYEVIFIVFIFFLFKRIKKTLLFLFLFSGFILITFDTLGISSIKLLYISLLWRPFDISSFIFYYCAWLVPLVSLAGFLLQLYDKNIAKD